MAPGNSGNSGNSGSATLCARTYKYHKNNHLVLGQDRGRHPGVGWALHNVPVPPLWRDTLRRGVKSPIFFRTKNCCQVCCLKLWSFWGRLGKAFQIICDSDTIKGFICSLLTWKVWSFAPYLNARNIMFIIVVLPIDVCVLQMNKYRYADCWASVRLERSGSGSSFAFFVVTDPDSNSVIWYRSGTSRIQGNYGNVNLWKSLQKL